MIRVAAYQPGIYPRSEEVVSATRGVERGRTSAEEVAAAFRDELADLVAAQRQAHLDLYSDGLLRWQDVFRPLVELSPGMDARTLVRRFDNNGFFRAPEGKTIDDVSRLQKFQVGDVKVTYLDVSGTFLSKNPPFDPNAKEVKKPDFRRFGVIFESPNGPYFITVTGPARTMEMHKKGFDEWLKNFK